MSILAMLITMLLAWQMTKLSCKMTYEEWSLLINKDFKRWAAVFALYIAWCFAISFTFSFLLELFTTILNQGN